MILVRADRSAGRTPPASSLAADPGRNQERPADRGVTAGSAAVMARCTAACPLVNRRYVSESGPGGRVSRTCRAGPVLGRAADRAASWARWARPPGCAGRRPSRRPQRVGAAAGATGSAAGSPTPSTRPAAPVHRRAARGACSGRRCPSRRAVASVRAPSRRSAGATSRGQGRPGRRAGRTAAGRGRPVRDRTTGAACPSPGAPRPTVRRLSRRHGRTTPRGRHATPPGRDPPLGRRGSPDRAWGQGLRLRPNGNALGQRSAHRCPQAWGQLPPIRPRRAVGEGRRTVVSAAHHQSDRSYPQYPQPCPQPWVIMLEALTWSSAAERPRDARSGRRSPQTGHR